MSSLAVGYMSSARRSSRTSRQTFYSPRLLSERSCCQVSQTELAYMGLIALGLSILMTVAFRFLAGVIVYVIIALVVVICVVGTITLWVVWYLKKSTLGKVIIRY